MFIDTTTRRRFQNTFVDGTTVYNVFWLDDGDRRMGISKDSVEEHDFLHMNEWIPFDVTVETVKMYFTFSWRSIPIDAVRGAPNATMARDHIGITFISYVSDVGSNITNTHQVMSSIVFMHMVW
jgi:hypothetical protein